MADFFVYASVPFVEHCLKDAVAYTKGKNKWGQNQKWLQSGVHKVAHKWARWLHNPCRLGGSPPLQSGGQNQRWPTSGQGGYITPVA